MWWRQHRQYATSAALVGLALAGLICIGVAVGFQTRPPTPPLSSGYAVSSAGTAGSAVIHPHPPPPAGRPRSLGPVLPASTPRSLAIPAIGVQTTLLRLGQTPQGSIEVPPPGPHYDKAGWYRYSPPPGSLGPAVIVGHVDSAAAGPSVFFRLGGLRPGNRVLVSRADGSVARFAVDEVRRYSKTGFPTDLVYGNTDHAALRLISCGGPFDRRTGHYRDNIVVSASLMNAG